MKKLPLLYLVLVSPCLIAVGQSTVTNPIQLDRSLPRVAKDPEYYRAGAEGLQRNKDVMMKLLAPEQKYLREYKRQLSDPRFGIIKLFSPVDCPVKISKPRSEDLLELSKKCPVAYMVGSARNFSFRKREYVDANRSDLTFENGLIFSNGLLTQPIMTDLGERAITDVDLASDGLSEIKKIVPSTDPTEIDSQNDLISKGITRGGFVLGRGFKPILNHTYALRVIAYRADLSTWASVFELRFRFDPFHDDRREDIIVAFKIVGEDETGVTIVWRELLRLKSPKLKRGS